ncbi:hypothetical protein GCM10017608_10380 [Agromyces luteolus]|uniref:Helix-turn-helix domain-containing protein n=1 Tax=Agromyces luteolus TaxID=88373 RepID=A0A7C9LGA1_9MICO|nr:hypothetical protein [Agromyces luteolus]MUN08570.1 hypothetical protein [Agromyces luteolus]GLK27105.1 hypothetical protein GCM10017608_10380 [Agromyces luteolus]
MSMVTAGEAARRLGISRRRVAELWHAGALRGSKNSAGLSIELASVHERELIGAIPGRPWSGDIVWEVIAILSGEAGTPTDTSEASRRILKHDSPDLARRMVAAVDVERYDARDLERDRDDIRRSLALTGASALDRIERDRAARVVDQQEGQSIHGYVRHDDASRDAFLEEFDLVPSPTGDVFLHRFKSGTPRIADETPAALVAADCTRSTTTRIRRAGLDALERMRNAWLAERS